ncbi:MAG: hypothetical protein ACOH5I_12540 [Oligoflexus sp.]
MIAKISLIPWIFVIACTAYASPQQSLPLQVLLQEVFQREYQLIATKPEQYELTAQQMHRVWLAGYLAFHHLPIFTAEQIPNLEEQAKSFQVGEAQLKKWQAATSSQVLASFLALHTDINHTQKEAVGKRLNLEDNKNTCDLTESLTQQMEASVQNIVSTNFWRKADKALSEQELVCFSTALIARYQKTRSEDHDPKLWLAAILAHEDQPNLRLLASWRALYSQDYRASLEYLYPIVYQDPAFRYAYEAVQRVYQFAEKGKGAVALKRL